MRLVPASWRSFSKRKLYDPDSALPVVLESGQRPRLLADVALGVAAAGAEREELHQLAPVVLVRRPLRVLRAREPEEHRRVLRDLEQQLLERAERQSVAGACSGPASASASRPRRARSRTSRARRASSARRAGGRCAPSGRATTGDRGPRRRRARARGPCRRAEPGRPTSRPSDASASERRRRSRASRAPRPRPCAGRSRHARAGARPVHAQRAPCRRQRSPRVSYRQRRRRLPRVKMKELLHALRKDAGGAALLRDAAE